MFLISSNVVSRNTNLSHVAENLARTQLTSLSSLLRKWLASKVQEKASFLKCSHILLYLLLICKALKRVFIALCLWLHYCWCTLAPLCRRLLHHKVEAPSTQTPCHWRSPRLWGLKATDNCFASEPKKLTADFKNKHEASQRVSKSTKQQVRP